MSNEHAPHSGATFDDQFRGSPAEIRRRLSNYLPLLEEVGLRENGLPLLDLGSGRGEWLQLLADHGYSAVGVDANEEAVSRCRTAGLDVTAGDVFDDLKQRPDGSVSGVTAFQVIEHLDPRRLGELLREASRVLAPGGLAIFETPNPENITVGTVSFHLDSEHVRPVPPALMEFHALQAGFARAWIARVNRELQDAALPWIPDDAPGALEMNALVYAVNGLLFAAPDYALVAVNASDKAPPLEDSDFERLFGPQPLGLSTHRRLAAEEAARELQAHNLELQARSAQLELEAAAAEVRASEAESRASILQHASDAARNDMATVSSSLSWRLTAPLRAVSAAVRGEQGMSGIRQGGSPKRYAKMAVGFPMRWALSQPRLGPALDRQLVKVPPIEHKVRIAIHEVTTVRVTRCAAASEDIPPDLAAVSEHARGVFADLRRSLEDRAE